MEFIAIFLVMCAAFTEDTERFRIYLAAAVAFGLLAAGLSMWGGRG